MQTLSVTTTVPRADDLSPDDYRAIYDELRERTTLRQFAEYIGSTVTFAWWSKYERGQAALDTERKNELRRAVGLPPLAPPATDLLAQVTPSATVHQIGTMPATRVAALGHDTPQRIVLEIAGEHCRAHTPANRPTANRRYYRPALPRDLAARVPALAQLLRSAIRGQDGQLAAGWQDLAQYLDRLLESST